MLQCKRKIDLAYFE